MQFISPSDPRLNQKSEEIPVSDIGSDSIQNILESMLDIAFGETRDYNKSILVGLAAPQIGIQKRIILVDLAATGVFTKNSKLHVPQIDVFINPEILWRSEEILLWREGCFSTSRICGIVPRSACVHIRAFDRKGNVIEREFSGYTARIFQHEIDHLDGIRFPDRVFKDEHLHWVETADLPHYRIDWKDWKETYPREKWIKMKCF